MAPLLALLRRPCANVLRKAYAFEKINIGASYTAVELIRRDLSDASLAKLSKLPSIVQDYVKEKADIMQPDDVHVCDGSKAETQQLFKEMEADGMVKRLTKYENCWIARTDPKDVARVESKTVISTEDKRETIPTAKDGKQGRLGYWMSPSQLQEALDDRFPNCMKGRTMYVIPFSMGPIGGPISKNGIQLTDSRYVVASMGIMTRVSQDVLPIIEAEQAFVKCMHSVGAPLPLQRPIVNNWPCHPEKVMISHIPKNNEIQSYGSGYGGNSLLGKKCFALRIGSTIAHREGWLAEHMLILGITNPQGVKKYIAAAFPSQCGKTNLAMMEPSLPGWKIECVGDDIAWMKYDANGVLRAINPENGFFGVAPGTSKETNPNALTACQKNTVFTNVAETSDGGVYWEGMGETPKNVTFTSWKNQPWTPDSKELAAHPNSRFCCPASQCPTIDPNWESAEGVPIDAIIFGGRRPEGVPLVYEAFNWQHGVYVGAAMRSEATSAAEHTGKAIMHDPFAMRPFFGYNFGRYLSHWLSMDKPGRKMPKIFHVNWFRKNEAKKFMWPGFGENSRVLEWVFERTNDNNKIAVDTAIGKVPAPGSLNVDGLKEKVDMEELFSLPKDFWVKEVEEIQNYFDEQVNEDLPKEVQAELNALRERVHKM